MVSIRDIGSLHGTYLNGSQLRGTQAKPLADGDIVKFGISIDRANDKFPQCVMQVGLTSTASKSVIFPKYFVSSTLIIRRQNTQPTTFQVPDESDVDDFTGLSDDDDEEDLQHGLAALKENGLLPKLVVGCATSDPIDLTSEPDVDSSWGDDPDSTSQSSEELPDPQYTEIEQIRDDDWDHPHDATMETEGFAPASQYTEACSSTLFASAVAYDNASQPPDVEAHGSAATGGEPSSYMPAILEAVQSAQKAEALGELTGKTEYFQAREHNRVLAQRVDTITEVETKDAAIASIVGQDATGKATSDAENVEEHNGHLDEVPDTMELDSLSLPEVEILREGNNTDVCRTGQTIDNATTNLKRKFEEISDVLHKERATASGSEAHVDIGQAAIWDSANTATQGIEVAASAAPAAADRPVKAFRRFAEAFGYAALGGAAVVSALIATAPNF